MHRWRHRSLRTQQVVFFSAISTAILALMIVTILAGARYVDVFAANLAVYFRVHELRTTLTATHRALDSYVRTADEARRTEFTAALPLLARQHRAIDPLAHDQLSRFEINATLYGLAAYQAAAAEALVQYEAGVPLYYLEIERANRIRGYIDSYLDNLFRIQLELGRSNYSAALERQRSSLAWSTAAAAAVGALLLLFAFAFSRTVTLPIAALAAAAQRMAGGDLGESAMQPAGNREITVLTRSFNTMNRSIRRLIEDLKDKHEIERRLHAEELRNVQMYRSLREAQLVALQAQINPHFLFNTLNSIARTARIEHAESSEQLIRSLSAVLRYILRDPGRHVPLSEELSIVQEYMHLQGVRFGERLQCRVERDQSVEVRVPRLCIQPLVENAIKYGIEPKEAGGSVRVVTTGITDEHGRWVRVEVADSGIGMDREHVEHLLRDPNRYTDEGTDGIGVLNVRHRLSLIYPDHRFWIHSTPGEGTTVGFDVPADLEQRA